MNSTPLLNLAKETIRVNTLALAGFPGSVFLFFAIFSADSLLGQINAKNFFLLGLVVEVVSIYAIGILLFPASSQKPGSASGGVLNTLFEETDISTIKNLIPYATYTEASIFASIVGFLVAYWSSLNMLAKTENAEIVSLIYTLVAIIFLLFEIFILQEDWHSLVASLTFGIIFGIIWAQLFMQRDEILIESQTTTTVSKDGTTTTQCASSNGNNQNEDMICRAFRM